MAGTIVWFRQDLRWQDNPALAAAFARGAPVWPVFILDDAAEGAWKMGAASRWWLHHSLAALDASWRGQGLALILARGDSGAEIARLRAATDADAVYWNRRYEPAAIARDTAIKAELTTAGVDARSFNAALLHEPHTVQNKSGGPFQVFTPYWRHCLALPVETAVKAGGRVTGAADTAVKTGAKEERGTDGHTTSMRDPGAAAVSEGGHATGEAVARKAVRSLNLEDLELLPTLNWAKEFSPHWQPGEAGARARWKRFLAQAVDGYATDRDQPEQDATSGLSPHLHFGEVGPRQIWASLQERARDRGAFPSSRGAQVFLAELGWREFAHHLLFHFPRTTDEPLRAEFAAFPWRTDPAALRAWQRGETGYPIVDAGMRQLWRTGWMHNRVRMIVASFLVKHLRISWREGAAWFWDTLVDADLANNTLGWQWSAGCGADAAPYFRIFNPFLQGAKFDPDGGYVRRWVPELARVPAKFIHAPWTAPAAELGAAGVRLGEHYPRPAVDHAEARAAALAAWQKMREKRPELS